MKKQVTEELTRIKQMMTSIIKEDFEFPNSNNNNMIVDCDFNILDSDTFEIVVMYNEEDKDETYLISLEFEYEDGEPQTYDYPGSSGGASGSVNGIKMISPEERILTSKEFNDLITNKVVAKCVYSAIQSMEESAYESREDSDDDSDDYYDRSKEY